MTGPPGQPPRSGLPSMGAGVARRQARTAAGDSKARARTVSAAGEHERQREHGRVAHRPRGLGDRCLRAVIARTERCTHIAVQEPSLPLGIFCL
jgi:hypothetical protein